MLAEFIRVIHFLLVVFIIVTPFCGTPYMLSMHFLIVPFIMAHWLTNQTVCALTEMEKLLTGKDCDDETFFGKIVGPVYKFKTRREENLFVWTLLITLWLITFFKLHRTGFEYLKGEKARMLALWRSV
jgi:hypothetical protein